MGIRIPFSASHNQVSEIRIDELLRNYLPATIHLKPDRLVAKANCIQRRAKRLLQTKFEIAVNVSYDDAEWCDVRTNLKIGASYYVGAEVNLLCDREKDLKNIKLKCAGLALDDVAECIASRFPSLRELGPKYNHWIS
ncbi:hypothetical protein D4Q52_06755 [Rhodopseudomonas palustris]|uniref:Uncharacterized protein n=1 Tax=Rhodopseudomonas palustris TaxID=1076 RepID=A0A418VJI0_RHOPL|nr:hypothetical protein D4Q52_06755 [Rhodopseudomonas palustris]